MSFGAAVRGKRDDATMARILILTRRNSGHGADMIVVVANT